MDIRFPKIIFHVFNFLFVILLVKFGNDWKIIVCEI